MDTQKLIVDKIAAVLDSTDKNQSAELKKLIDQCRTYFCCRRWTIKTGIELFGYEASSLWI